VNTNQGGTSKSIIQHIKQLDLSLHRTIFLQLGGHDACNNFEQGILLSTLV